MSTKYRIEGYNRYTKKYAKIWEGNSFERAQIMFNKPYYRTQTRKLIRIDEEIIIWKKLSK